ncbi:hypothetical protein DHEL01_v204415 [Diaporthe helianthi]|uniref:Protein kinase domain-containing protein n=1 Tax=Diaporthe helianthi TaxID=158607 RepID=A0A2P5I3V8_DIAHE|nr:hypothetical protein DHEL01_v204415 [Diaporthe helianthi]
MATTLPEIDLESVDLASSLESVDLGDNQPKWALMALDPSGKMQLLVTKLVSGIESDAMVFRELGAHGSGSGSDGDNKNERKLSVAKWNREPQPEAKMARPGREVRVAQLLATSDRACRFAALLSAQDMAGGYRESWWSYYNVGDMQHLHTTAFRFCQPQPPLSLVFRCVAQVLEGIQCMNSALDVRHMDLHAGNIFFHLAEDATYPDAVIGDFGLSRFKGERPTKLSISERGEMSPEEERQNQLSPPPNSDETFGTEDYSWRLRWDVHQFQLKIPEVLLENFSGRKANNELLFGFFKRLAKISAQDEKDRKLPDAERPPVQDLAPLIHDAWTLERLYADTKTDKVALAHVRSALLDKLRKQPSEPRIFDTAEDARDAFEHFIDAGMLRVVNLLDDGSLDAAAAELASFKIPDSAYVSDQSDSSSLGTPDSSASSGPSTKWSPATRGVAEALAFADGDASALQGLLAARDAEEMRQALIREEHARRYRQQQGISQLFRR